VYDAEMQEANVSNEPITKSDQDRLHRSPFAAAVADCIFKRITTREGDRLLLLHSLSIAIIGGWGQGKTSLLYLIQERLGELTKAKGLQEPVFVWFNPWRYGDEDALLSEFFAKITSNLPVTAKEKKRIWKTVRKYTVRLSQPVEGVLDIVGDNVGWPWKILTVSCKWLLGLVKDEPQSLEQQKHFLADEFGKLHRPVVVFIDDVDRLYPEEIVQLLKLIRVNADFPNLVYVSAFDSRHLEEALKNKGVTERPREYMEKIFHVPFSIPAPSRRDLVEVLVEGVNAVANPLIQGRMEKLFIQEDFDNAFVYRASRYFKSVRDITRYLSGIEAGIGALRAEVDPLDFMLVELLRIFEPTAYQFLVDLMQDEGKVHICNSGQSLVHDSSKKLDERLKKVELSAEARDILGILFTQKLGGGGGMGYARHFKTDACRIEELDQYDRYFTYHVDGLSEKEFIAVATAHGEQLETEYKKLFEKKLVYEYLEALRYRARMKEVPFADAMEQARYLLNEGHRLYKKKSGVWDLPDFWALSLCLHNLMYLHVKTEHEAIMTMMRETYLTSKSYYALATLIDAENRRSQKPEKDGEYFLSQEDVDELLKILQPRIESEYIAGAKMLDDPWCSETLASMARLITPEEVKKLTAPVINAENVLRVIKLYQTKKASQTIGSVYTKLQDAIEIGSLDFTFPLERIKELIEEAKKTATNEDVALIAIFEKSVSKYKSKDWDDDE
jgi:hypothetical protein